MSAPIHYSEANRAELQRRIVRNWPGIQAQAERRGVKPGAWIPKRPKILGSSIKVEKGEKKKHVLTAVLYLPPAESAYGPGSNTLCPWSTPECRAACLVDSGQLAMQPNARMWKETLRRGAPELFKALLSREIEAHAAKARKLGKRAAVRLDGTSDIGLAGSYSRRFPDVQFYDYTKSPTRALNTSGPNARRNWHVTFSYSGRNLEQALKVLRAGGNVAVVFQAKPPRGDNPGDPLPESWHGFPVLNGDDTDVRFDDPPGHVVGLSLKGNDKWAERVAKAGRFAVPLPTVQA